MGNITIRCKSCNRELSGCNGKSISCGCPNMATISGDKISAVDLSKIVMINSVYSNKKSNSNFLTNEDLAFQESRRKRKIRKLDFEVR